MKTRPKGKWSRGRVVEGARLESVYTGNRIEGSNPSDSAIYLTYKRASCVTHDAGFHHTI